MGLNIKTKVLLCFFFPTGTTDKNWQIYHQFIKDMMGISGLNSWDIELR